jgi:hypothetical protein
MPETTGFSHLLAVAGIQRGLKILKKSTRVVLPLAIAVAILSQFGTASAQQALPTASQALQLSAFAGLSGVDTGLSNGRNLSFTTGADLGLPAYLGVRPTIEIRGTYPMDSGTVDSQKDILGGLKIDFLIKSRLRPYADFLLGRGQIDYGRGYQVGNVIYLLTTTNVFSPGAGFDYDVTPRFSLRVDWQIQHWGDAPTPSGSIYSKVVTAALIYRFDFNRHGMH